MNEYAQEVDNLFYAQASHLTTLASLLRSANQDNALFENAEWRALIDSEAGEIRKSAAQMRELKPAREYRKVRNVVLAYAGHAEKLAAAFVSMAKHRNPVNLAQAKQGVGRAGNELGHCLALFQRAMSKMHKNQEGGKGKMKRWLTALR